jgi:hypothetical protein
VNGRTETFDSEGRAVDVVALDAEVKALLAARERR